MKSKFIKHIEGGNYIDIANGGINPYLGEKDCVITRFSRNYKLLNGIPGTGLYVRKESYKFNPAVLMTLCFMTICVIVVAVFIMANADFSISYFFSHFFDKSNIILIGILAAIIFFRFFFYAKYLFKLGNRPNVYKSKIQNEIDSVNNNGLDKTEDTEKKNIYQAYKTCLEYEYEMVDIECIAKALQERRGKKYDNSKRIYLNEYNKLQDIIFASRYRMDDGLSSAQNSGYSEVCESYEMLYSNARTWDVSKVKDLNKNYEWRQCTMGIGIFDYILSNSFTPTLYTADGRCIYLYSKYVIVSRTTVDFDIIPYDSISFKYMDYKTNSSLGMMVIPELDVKIISTDNISLKTFIEGIEAYRKGDYSSITTVQDDPLLEEAAVYFILKRKVLPKMLKTHFEIGSNRTKKILSQLESYGVISPADNEGVYTIIIWDIDKIREIFSKTNREV